MSVKLYVGGIPYTSKSEDLRGYFEAAGAVEDATILMDKMTGRSRGFGFVTMADDAAANKAIEMFHDKEFEGRKLSVNIARPMEERPPRRDFNRRSF
jgi:RNA recognition motif-containing protein